MTLFETHLRATRESYLASLLPLQCHTPGFSHVLGLLPIYELTYMYHLKKDIMFLCSVLRILNTKLDANTRWPPASKPACLPSWQPAWLVRPTDGSCAQLTRRDKKSVSFLQVFRPRQHSLSPSLSPYLPRRSVGRTKMMCQRPTDARGWRGGGGGRCSCSPVRPSKRHQINSVDMNT